MRLRFQILLAVILLFIGAGILTYLLKDAPIAVLQPGGIIARRQRDLLVIVTLLSLIVIIPVYLLTFFIVWKYRAGNKKARYEPDWAHSWKLETIWWGVPFAIIVVLSAIIWDSSHALDPYKPIAAGHRPLVVQVVALQWKWLFIYPEQGIATVNHLQIPEDTPVEFHVTSDAPMNSLWIPQLGGQVYAMSGMTTKLHLMADEPGVFNGSSANISGEGYAGMTFKATAVPRHDFFVWARDAVATQPRLNWDDYQQLARPSKNVPPATFVIRENTSMYDRVIDKYMGTGHQANHMEQRHAR